MGRLSGVLGVRYGVSCGRVRALERVGEPPDSGGPP